MVMYYGKRFDSASVGSRLVEVVCDKCECEYCYELARVGSGAATAPYAIGGARAAKSAGEQARKDLERRLTEEAELVPCPNCQWINEALVSGYRRGRYRGWMKLAGAIALVGVAASLAIAWFLSMGPPGDQAALPYVLIGGPAISLAVAGFLLGLRHGLRSRIQPNRNHPFPPKLPHGSPVAVVRNPTTGELEYAGSPPKADADGGDGAWMDFQVGRNGFPPICCACLGPATPGCGCGFLVRPAVTLVVPRCASCARRSLRRKWLGVLIGLAVAAVIGLPILLVLQLDEVIFWAMVLVLGLLIPTIGGMIADYINTPVRVKIVDGARGVVRLWFRNENFPKTADARV